MTHVWRSAWREPRAADPPPTGGWDWALAGGFTVAVLVEGLARPGLPWRPLVILLALALAPALLLRRRHPLAACLVGFGVAGVSSAVQLWSGSGDVGLSSMTVVVVLLYGLVRWGSGREIVLGLPFVAAVVALGMSITPVRGTDIVGGILFLLLFVAVAAVVRSRADLWERRRREIRNQERLALARELHDTVAHHISAIAVQAQAGGVVAPTRPDEAARVLAAIESEASRTLEAMRAMVRVLREDAWEAYAPQPGMADLPTLARPDGVPTVTVSLTGTAAPLPGAVDAAIYRIAQEAMTNALRHARGATRVEIDVSRVGDRVRLVVTDDGPTVPGAGAEPGFGLTGMAERAQLLGGSFAAGPRPEGGWVVEAVLPTEVTA